MSEETIVLDDAGNPVDERAVLMARAKDLNMRVSPKIGLDKLRDKVNAAMNGEPDPSPEEKEITDSAKDGKGAAGNDKAAETTAPVTTEDASPKAPEDYTVDELKALPKVKREMVIRARMRKEELRLIRCQIYNLDPSKNDIEGEIFSVTNPKYLGTVRKFIPFGEKTEGGYHIPNILYKALKNRKFLQKRSVRNRKTSRIELKTEWVPEFNIIVLDPLTEDELSELAHVQQAAARAVGDT